jgi:hypothetical protein
MCKALEDGGQRCSAHTAPHYRRALEEIVNTLPVTIEHLEKLESTAELYASTSDGRSEVTFDMSRMEAAGRWDEAALLRAALTKGRIRSMVSKETAKVISSTIAKTAIAKVRNAGIVDTYPKRLAMVSDLQERYNHAKSIAHLATSLAGGLGAAEGKCVNCIHLLHQGVICNNGASQEKPCSCAASTPSTPEQIAAFELRSEARALREELQEATKQLEEPQVGDHYTVAKSRDANIPVGLKGTLVCLVKKDWGMRALLETESGGVWVGLKSLTRDIDPDQVTSPMTPEVQGDPIPVLAESAPASRVSLALEAMQD